MYVHTYVRMYAVVAPLEAQREEASDRRHIPLMACMSGLADTGCAGFPESSGGRNHSSRRGVRSRRLCDFFLSLAQVQEEIDRSACIIITYLHLDELAAALSLKPSEESIIPPAHI